MPVWILRALTNKKRVHAMCLGAFLPALAAAAVLVGSFAVGASSLTGQDNQPMTTVSPLRASISQELDNERRSSSSPERRSDKAHDAHSSQLTRAIAETQERILDELKDLEQPPRAVEIRIKTLSGASFTCTIGLFDRVAKLMAQIRAQTGVPEQFQILSNNGRRLRTNDNLGKYSSLESGVSVNLLFFSGHIGKPDDIEEKLSAWLSTGKKVTTNPYNAPIFREAADDSNSKSPFSEICLDSRNWVFSPLTLSQGMESLIDLFDPVAHLDLTKDESDHLAWAKNQSELFGPESVPTISEFGHYGMLRTKVLMGIIEKERSFYSQGIQLGIAHRPEEKLDKNINNYAPDALGDEEIINLFEASEWVRQQLARDEQTGEGNLSIAEQKEINRDVLRAYLEATSGMGLAKDISRDEHDGGGNCPICIDTLAAEPAIKLPCGHAYHTDCIVEWVRGWRNRLKTPQCPYCRNEFGLPHILSLRDITTK